MRSTFGTKMKLKLSPAERDILCLLEEAGSEELQTLLASLPKLTESEIDQARRSLHKAGFIYEYSTEVILTGEGRQALTK